MKMCFLKGMSKSLEASYLVSQQADRLLSECSLYGLISVSRAKNKQNIVSKMSVIQYQFVLFGHSVSCLFCLFCVFYLFYYHIF